MRTKFLDEKLERSRALRQAKFRSGDNIKNGLMKESVRALTTVISVPLFILFKGRFFALSSINT
jgi:hypothetical protein